MKKHLLTLVMLLMGSVAWAQDQIGSGWTDPASEYSHQTVVYFKIQSSNYDVLYTPEGGPASPEVAAFVDGELRGWTNWESIQVSPQDKSHIFCIRVGGVIGTDDGKNITFQVYDSNTRVIYNLACQDEITWNGDETGNYPSEYYTMTFEPATALKLYNGEVEITELSLHVNEEVSLGDCTAKLVNSAGTEVEAIFQGKWEINEVYPYISLVESDGAFTIKGMQETPDGNKDEENDFVEEVISYVVGTLVAPISVQVLPEYFPVTSIAIEDVNYYWSGYGRLVLSDDMVTYNNGETTPTNPGVKIVSSSNEDVVAIVGDQELNYKGIGSSEITVAAIDDESVTNTFTVNVLSGLESIQVEGNGTYSYDRYSSGEETIDDLPTPEFNWIMDESGAPVVGNGKDESFTVISSDPSILEIKESEAAGFQFISHKKGTVTLTYTSNYDPDKKAVLTVVITQGIENVKITKIGDTEVSTSPTHETSVDVAVGQGVTATVKINPADADFENIVIMITDADGYSPIDSEIVTTGDPILKGDGTYEFTFTFLSVPDGYVYLQAIIDENRSWSDRVQLNVIQSVTSITPVPEEITLWLTEAEIGQYTGTIKVTVLPEDATNKELEVVTSDENIVSVEVGDEGYTYTIHEKGTATITFTSVDNPSVSAECVITVKKKVESIELEMEEGDDLFNDGMFHDAYVYFYPEDADYDVDKLTAYVNNEAQGDIELGDWQFVTVEEYGAFDGGMHFGIAGLALCDYAQVIFSYDAAEQGNETSIETSWEGRVIEKIRFDYGWNWISVISAGVSLNEIEPSLDEARSQTELAIVDPEWGLFGYLSWLYPSEAYKVKIKDDAEVLEYIPLEGGWMNADGTVDEKVLEHGWNWESYPYEYDYSLADIFDAEQFEEGDIILSKDDGMATIVDGAWEGNLDMLRYHQGYLIYSNTEGEYSVTMPNRYSLPQGSHMEDIPRAQRRDRSVWSYDGSRFANVMAIVGKIEVEDAEDYTIGAFVGDECRGEGKFVNGKAYITAAGKAGDMVTLRLYNQWTGEYVEVLGEVAFTDIAGSAKEPIRFNAVETGVGHLSAATLTIQANVAYASGDIQVYDAQGKLVAEGYQRVDLNHLNQGIYMVKSGDQSRKIVK